MPKTIVRTSLRSPNNDAEKRNQAHVRCVSINICVISLYGMSQAIAPSHNQSFLYCISGVFCLLYEQKVSKKKNGHGCYSPVLISKQERKLDK